MTHLEELEENGYVILEGVLDREQQQALRSVLQPHFERHLFGRNPFEGHNTQRVYGLLAKSRLFDALIAHPAVMAACEATLGPGFLLSVAHAILIHPGEVAQSLHHDDSFYPLPRPRQALGVSTIWALDDFTEDNGATRIVPGSHRWNGDRPDDAEARPVIMPAGSLLIFLGTLYHGGGENCSAGSRLGLTIQYCPAWARQQENFILGVPAGEVPRLSETIQELIGYGIHPPFMGHVDGRHPLKALQT
ncbi:MAG: phytanoyl-CoA dioxygenase family protein [Acidobacteriota bacterium]|nr:phytanoyl-CoA dioxygenase family protein [Acidobacteriota bacterium]